MIAWMIGRRYSLSRDRNQMVAFISRVSTLGLVLGVAMLITVLSVMNGFDRELRERILGIMPQAAVYHRFGVADWRRSVQRAEEFPGVVAAAPFVQVQALATRKNRVAPLMLFGVDADREVRVSSLSQLLPDYQSLLKGDTKAFLLGAVLAQKLGVQVGDRLSLVVPDADNPKALPKLTQLTVSAIVSTGTEADGSLALTNLSTAAALTSHPDRVSGIRLKVADLFAAPDIARQLSRHWGYGHYSSDWTRTHGNLYQAIHMSKRLVSMLLFLIIGIAAFNVVTTLIMVVSDKRSDIAILRTMGASSGQIMKIFLLQGAVIGSVGTLAGVVLGLGLSLVVTDLVAALESLIDYQFLKSDVYPISYLPSAVQWQDVLLVVSAALLLSTLAAVYPAWKASRTRPAEALRYEV